jgi:hypothetical protein
MSTEFIFPVVLNVHPMKKSGNKSDNIVVWPYKVLGRVIGEII